ncbi:MULTISPECIES: 50S ribosomal protein L24 [Lacticaseibacillus]|jgi:large subunit ribosomal protein L24|uniref:Large ribosomal subunit protein uL24 n=2 Tax=Lacticaseibacillus manihotivorans TaxID=88233 RepID=A0A0R1QJN6_9LACO|nr:MULTISPECIES: 50S ribosomal protein L24 [Lacticaseibacillus]KRL44670.1 50S ribosomal protein L24 [Lacticaseibacillus manihotivorans DSM 13343 = JCM 12514]QFQ92611.1 50S ribosomal protein L24 [Lacticaseibacillus manihotivorans]
MKIKTGDKVRVMRGKDAGKEGTVTKVLLKADKVIVEGVNIVKKHQKPSNANPQGGIVDVEAAIHVSNVMLLDPESNKPSRTGVEIKDGKKVRIAKKSGAALEK